LIKLFKYKFVLKSEHEMMILLIPAHIVADSWRNRTA